MIITFKHFHCDKSVLESEKKKKKRNGHTHNLKYLNYFKNTNMEEY